jgi:hypothetical protein
MARNSVAPDEATSKNVAIRKPTTVKSGMVLGLGVVCLINLCFGTGLLSECRAAGLEGQLRDNPLAKITFNLAQLNQDGLYGPPDGLRALHYEFCIPGVPAFAAQVKSLDPTLVILKESPGRIGCTKQEFLCLGSTHQPNFMSVLLGLAKLPYVKRIDQAFFE